MLTEITMPKDEPLTYVFTPRIYIDNAKREVIEHVPVFGSFPPDYNRFWGRSTIDLEGGMSSPITFPIRGATNFEEAYGRFAAAQADGVQDFLKRMKAAQEAESRKIIRPPMNAPLRIVKP